MTSRVFQSWVHKAFRVEFDRYRYLYRYRYQVPIPGIGMKHLSGLFARCIYVLYWYGGMSPLVFHWCNILLFSPHLVYFFVFFVTQVAIFVCIIAFSSMISFSLIGLFLTKLLSLYVSIFHFIQSMEVEKVYSIQTMFLISEYLAQLNYTQYIIQIIRFSTNNMVNVCNKLMSTLILTIDIREYDEEY